LAKEAILKYETDIFNFKLIVFFDNFFAQKKDTNKIIIAKRLVPRDTGVSYIYLIQNRDPKLYNHVVNYFSEDYYKETYQHSLEQLHIEKQVLNKNEIKIAYAKWIPLNLYKGRYYVYSPCDFYFYYSFAITDSTVIEFNGEAALAYKFIGITQKKSVFNFELLGEYNQHRTLNIYIVDSINGIAIFELINKQVKRKDYYLMVATKNATKFPLITNECYYGKVDELDFDTPNFRKILKTKPNFLK